MIMFIGKMYFWRLLHRKGLSLGQVYQLKQFYQFLDSKMSKLLPKSANLTRQNSLGRVIAAPMPMHKSSKISQLFNIK